MARIDPMADASLPDMRARSSPGTAMAAMMPMIGATISSWMRVKSSFFCVFFKLNLLGCDTRANSYAHLIGKHGATLYYSRLTANLSFFKHLRGHARGGGCDVAETVIEGLPTIGASDKG